MILQANIGGYKGRLATVIGYLDLASNTLFIKRAEQMVARRFNNETGLITNQPLNDYDYLFSEANFNDAFNAYRFYQNSQRLIFDEKAKRAIPPLEVEKITESGTQFAIYGDISNEQLAVISLCFFAKMVGEAQVALAQYDELTDFDEWQVISI